MKTMKLKAKYGGVTVVSAYPQYKYHVKEEGQIFDVPVEHAKKMLLHEDLFEKVIETKKVISDDA